MRYDFFKFLQGIKFTSFYRKPLKITEQMTSDTVPSFFWLNFADFDVDMTPRAYHHLIIYNLIYYHHRFIIVWTFQILLRKRVENGVSLKEEKIARNSIRHSFLLCGYFPQTLMLTHFLGLDIFFLCSFIFSSFATAYYHFYYCCYHCFYG